MFSIGIIVGILFGNMVGFIIGALLTAAKMGDANRDIDIQEVEDYGKE